jgi:predicted nuclease of predicted toxin-antitoxin system
MAEIYNFLFDECLTLDLVAVANSLGHWGRHVNHLGRTGESDPALAVYARDRDLVVVTNNRVDFLQIYKKFEIHNGLVVIIPSIKGARQEQLFADVVVAISKLPDIVNKLVEIDIDGQITITDWPPLLTNTPEI